MTRKRYATIHGTDYNYEGVDYHCKKKKKASKTYGKKRGWLNRKRKRLCVSFDRLLTYDDGLSGECSS